MKIKTKHAAICSSLLISTSLLMGCGGGSGGSQASTPTPTPVAPPPTATLECGGQFMEEGNECLEVDGRHSVIYKPEGQTEAKAKAKAIAIFLHGAPGESNKVMGIFDARHLAQEYDLISLAPVGTEPTWAWNSVNKELNPNNSDVEFIQELITRVQSENTIASDKIYVFGYSAGGFMNYKLACEIPEKIEAIVSLAGQFRGDLETCSTSTPVSVHHFHSPSDTDVPMEGRAIGAIMSVTDTVEHWKLKNGCGDAPELIDHPGVTSSSSGTSTEMYNNCTRSVAYSQMAAVQHESDYDASQLEVIFKYLFDE